ncbi:MAG: NAD-dependent epimerase [Patescibacteria group bacterium]
MHKNSFQKILITGAFGMLGREVLKQVLKKFPNAKVFATDVSFPSENLGLPRRFVLHNDTKKNCVFQILDITKKEELENFFSKNQIDLIFHIAGVVSYNLSDAKKMFDVNIDGTKNLCEVAERFGVKKIVYASSVSAVKILDGKISTEKDTPDEEDELLNNYSKSKLLAEKEFFSLKSEKLEKIAVNFGVIVGESKNFESVKNFVRKFFILPKLQTFNSFVSVEDSADAMIFLAENGKNFERYVVSTENFRNGDFLKLFAENLGIKKVFIPVPKVFLRFFKKIILFFFKFGIIRNDAWKTMDVDKKFSSQKIFELGWKPKSSVEESVVKICRENF